MGVYLCVCSVDMTVGGGVCGVDVSVCVCVCGVDMTVWCLCVWCVCVCVHLICSGNRKMMSKMGHDTQYTDTNQFWDI